MKIEEALSHKEESSLRSLIRYCHEVREPKMNKVPQMLAPIMKLAIREVSSDIMEPLIISGLEVPTPQTILRSEMIIHRYNNTKYISTS
jgi:hypothetical protein